MRSTKALAMIEAQEQAEFLNEAGETMTRVTDGVSYEEMQLIRIADLLDTHGKKLVRKLAELCREEGL